MFKYNIDEYSTENAASHQEKSIDIGKMALNLTHGVATVARCEEALKEWHFVPASNTSELVNAAHTVLATLCFDLTVDCCGSVPTIADPG